VLAASDNLVWVVVHQASREAFVVDGPDAEGALDLCGRHGFRLSTVVNTHVHGDHIGINRDLERLGMLGSMRVVGAKKTYDAVPGITEAVDEGDTVDLFGFPAQVMLTEGHINGHLSYLIDGLLFCGDTLFAGGCGYLFDGPASAMYQSLLRLRSLPGETLVCCAHEYTQDNLRFAFSIDPDNAALRKRIADVWRIRDLGECTVPTTLELERATNPFLRFDDPQLRANVANAMPGQPLQNDADVFAATRALKDRKDYKAITDADLPL